MAKFDIAGSALLTFDAPRYATSFNIFLFIDLWIVGASPCIVSHASQIRDRSTIERGAENHAFR